MSENTLFNECMACKMKFESRQQLENHVKKFCIQSDYGNANKLEEKYQRELMQLKKNNVPGARDLQTSAKIQVKDDPLSLEALKDKAKREDEEYRKLQRLAQRRREEDMDDELNKLRDERQQIRLKRDDDQRVFQELLHELEQKKEKEIRAKVEKDEIRRALIDLEKTKLTTIEQDKKRELERLVQEREALRMKENELITDIQQLENNGKTLDQMRKDEIDKINGVIDGMQLKQKTNNRVNEQMAVDKADQVARLQLKREQLEGERLRIMDNLDKIRNGDLTALKRGGGGLNLVQNAKNILGEMRQLGNYNADVYKDRFQKDIDRINDLKAQKPEYMPFDGDEAWGPKQGVGQFATDLYKNKNPQTQEQLQAFREGMQRQTDVMQNQSLSQSVNISQLDSKQGRRPIQQPQQRVQSQIMQANPTQSSIQQQQQIEVPKNIWGAPIPQFQENKFQMIQQPQFQQPQFQQQAVIQQQPGFQQQPTYQPVFQFAGNNVPMQVVQPQTQVTTFGQFALNNLTQGQDPGKASKKIKDPWDIFSRKNEFFLMNEVRGVDLSEEERVLMSLNAQEVDAMRVISRIPVGTELYRFKMEQFKELSTMRAEIERIVQEQRLQDARREFEMERRDEDRVWENEKWVDDRKRFIIENRLRKDNTQKRSTQAGYNLSEGFVVYWDYTLGLPRRTNYGQQIFGIYNGQNVLYQPRLVEPRETETENEQHNRVIFGDSHQVFEVPPHPDTLMIMEVQIPFSKRVEENVGRTETYGWTQIDLFDHNKQLKRGKFKCPVYYGPTDPSITVEEIQNLQPIPNAWVYLRIGYPNDKEFGAVKTIYPEQSMHEYIVPYIHLRGLFGKREKVGQRMGMQEDITTRYGNRGYKMIEETIEESQLVNQGGAGGRLNQEEYELKEPPPPMQKYQFDDDPRNKQQPLGPKKGLRLIIYRVNNHQARSHLRVSASMLEEGSLVLDDTGQPVLFNTSIHNPLDLKNKQILQENYIIPLPKANVENEGMGNKAKGPDIIFQEEYRVFRNLFGMYRKNKKDIYIGLQVLEKPEPIELQDNQLNDTHKNYGGLEFELKGWQFLKISEPDGSLLTGRFKMKLLQPPLRRPPIDPTKVKEMEQIIDFALEEFEYEDKDIDEFKKLAKRKRPKPKEEVINDVALDNSPFIDNRKQLWVNDPFERRHGIDFYIDGLRYAPDKVTVCKIYMEVYNSRSERIFGPEGTLPELESNTFMPTYFYRRELRTERFDPTCMALMTIITRDKATNENRIVGYAAINLFLNPQTNAQPTDPNDDNFVAFKGAYQIPLFSQQIDRTPPFNMEKLQKTEKSPCCSLLVRINKAPLSEDGRRPLSIKEFKDPFEQKRRGILEPRPNYGAGAYNTQLCPITDSEKDLFAQRVTRADPKVRESAYLLLQGDYINEQYDDNRLYDYLDKKITLTHDTNMMDMMYFAKYRPQAGFRFAIDALHNVPQNCFFVCFFSLSSPGTFYLDPRDVTQGHMSSNYDWQSKINTPQFADEWFTFRENANKYQNIIIDVKSVPKSKVDGKITDLGWTVLPVFSPDGYIMSNTYQLPLFKGTVPRAVVEDLKKESAWDYLKQQQQNRKVFALNYTSVIVRLIDSQRDGHFNKRLDCDRLDYRYLPQEEDILQKWSYNPPVELAQQGMAALTSMIPSKDNPASFNRKLTEYFANSFGLTQYLSN